MGNIAIPLQDRGSVRSGMSMYAPCSRLATLAHAISWVLAGINPRFVPGRPTAPQIPSGVIETVAARISADIGDFDQIATYQPRQAKRTGIALLLIRRGDPVVFLKMHTGTSIALERERLATTLISAVTPKVFRTPRPFFWGALGGWSFVAFEPIPPARHRMPDAPPLEAIVDCIVEAFQTFPKPETTPDHWQPMHGDLTPWNLRMHPVWGLTLVDWEEAGWGPPVADETLYRATVRALGRDGGDKMESGEEATEFWSSQVRGRLEKGYSAFDTAVLEALAEK